MLMIYGKLDEAKNVLSKSQRGISKSVSNTGSCSLISAFSTKRYRLATEITGYNKDTKDLSIFLR